MKRPKVSIIVPNYNYAPFLAERIRSLTGQTFQDFELIIVDDASTDNSRSIIETYSSDSRVRTMFFDKNSGFTYKRWNDGAEIATGKYLMFAGADDSCDSTLLEKLVSALDEHPDVGVVYTRSWVIDSDGNRIKKKPRGERWDKDFIASAEEEIPFVLSSGSVQTASAALVRRTVFDRIGGWDSSFQVCADFLFWARALRTSKLAYIAQPLNYFRWHGKNRGATAGVDQTILEKYEVFGLVLREFTVSREVEDATWNHLLRFWISHFLQDPRRTNLRTMVRTFRAARKADASFYRRLAGVASASVGRFIRHRNKPPEQEQISAEPPIPTSGRQSN